MHRRVKNSISWYVKLIKKKKTNFVTFGAESTLATISLRIG